VVITKGTKQTKEKPVRRAAGWIRAAVVACSAVLLGGCYTYVGTSLAQAPVGGTVRAHVTNAAADRAEAQLGYHSTTLDGRLVQRQSASQLLLRVPAQVYTSGAETRRFYQRIQLSASDVLELETRRLDVARTAGITALGVAVVAYIVTHVLGGHNGGGVPPPSGGSPNPALVPVH
jgi:hypothetical protein